MSIRLPSCWLLAVALLIVAQSSALADQPKTPPVPQTAPPTVPAQTGPNRYNDVPLLIEEEQMSEHGTPHLAPPAPSMMPLGLPHLPPGQPTCDDDDDPNPARVMTLRCLLFTINPLAVFLPLEWHTEAPSADLPAPVYLQDPPQYTPRDLAFPLQREEASAEQVGMPDEVEYLDFMPTEIEPLDVMPAEESEPHYELLEPWNDSTNLFRLPLWPLTEIEVGVREQQTGAMLFGLGIELSRTGSIVVNGMSQTAAPEAGEVLPQPRPLTDIGPRTQSLESSQRVFGTVPQPSAADLAKYRGLICGCPYPTFTFELIANHTRLLELKEAPFRIQINDTTIADSVVLGPPTEVLVQGTKVGSTTMKMWFGDRNDPSNQTVLDFAVNVLPDPDVKARLEAIYKAVQVNEKMILCPANTQVQLNVVVAEMDGKAARTLNVNRKSGNASSWALEVADDARQKALRDGLSTMRENGHAKLVAEPCLVTLSGQQAAFLSGGEQAVPHTDAAGQQSVQFEEFGTRLNLRPIVQPDGSIRLEVDPEISEIGPVVNDDSHGVILAGRTSQSVHAVAELPRGHALVICGPKIGGKSRLMLIVTPTIVETPAAPKATLGAAPGFKCESFPEETVHELLLKSQRELSRGHVAGAQDLAQQALSRNREETLADPLVVAGLLQRVKEVATIPLGTVDPGTAKPASAVTGPQGEAKAIGSKERMVKALIDAFNVAFKEGCYREAESLAVRATEIDPENGLAVAARTIVRNQMETIRRNQESLSPMPPAVLQYAIIRPALPPVDPAVVNALQKILVDSEKERTGRRRRAVRAEGQRQTAAALTASSPLAPVLRGEGSVNNSTAYDAAPLLRRKRRVCFQVLPVVVSEFWGLADC